MNLSVSASRVKSAIKTRLTASQFTLAKVAASVLPQKKGGKVYDCFLFNNEFDVLLLRLSELYNSVDYFVIVECGKTFTGKDKPLHYLENCDKFKHFSLKIRYLRIPDPPQDAYIPNPANPSVVTSEFWQRDQFALGLLNVQPHDLVLFSDVDEIPRASLINWINKLCYYGNVPVYLCQDWYLLFLNIRVTDRDNSSFRQSHLNGGFPKNHQWLGSFACSGKALKYLYLTKINWLWSCKWGKGVISFPIVPDAGWHFSYMGGMKGLLSKIKDLGMRNYNQQDICDLRSGLFIGCNLELVDIDQSYPHVLQETPDEWNTLFLNCKNFEELADRVVHDFAKEGIDL